VNGRCVRFRIAGLLDPLASAVAELLIVPLYAHQAPPHVQSPCISIITFRPSPPSPCLPTSLTWIPAPSSVRIRRANITFLLLILLRKSLPAGISELFDLFPVDPDEPDNDDYDGNRSGDGPEDPELGGYDDAAGTVGGAGEEGAYTKDRLWGISYVAIYEASHGVNASQGADVPLLWKGWRNDNVQPVPS
jgi:hypothetical protein